MHHYDLDTILLELPEQTGSSYWTIRDSLQGTQIFGSLGSGKTSGSGRTLAMKFLSHGFGGLVLTAKLDEKEMWQEYCRLARRQDDLVIIEPGGEHFFNFLEYESSLSGKGSSITENLVHVLKTVIRASEQKDGGRSDDQFWESALDMAMFSVIDLCQLAFGKVLVQDMYDIILTSPRKVESKNPNDNENTMGNNAFKVAFEAARQNINRQVDDWMKKFSEERIKAMSEAGVLEHEISEAIPDARLLRFVDQFFVETYRNLAEKTRSIIEFSFSAFLFRLLKEPIYSLFCRYSSTVTPEDCLKGKIILLNIPVKQYHKVGRDSQIMFKYIWQRSMEKREVKNNGRPVFLWADEAQNFLHEHDADYQATARSSRIATVYISQNLPNYHANMGSEKSEYRVKGFLGTLGTKIFHANADIETNNYSSELLGEAYFEEHSRTSTIAGDFSTSETVSVVLERVVRPEEFVSLTTGGPINNYDVSCYIHRQGNCFRDGFNFKKIHFNQLNP